MVNDDYTGRIDPEAAEWKDSPWSDLVKERYRICSLFSENKRVLDSCCGTGWATVSYIANKSLSTVGIDICEPFKKVLPRAGTFSFIKMDARDITLEENNFDLVLALDSIEHFIRQDGLKYLKGLKRVCKEDGLVVGTTPLVPDKDLIGKFLEWNKYHLHMYTYETLENTLKSVFPAVEIFRIYNRVCPYFLFLCKKTGTDIPADINDKIKGFLSDHEKNLVNGKRKARFFWAGKLFLKGNLFKAFRFFLAATFGTK
ncbi:MAG: class I SAM-dependent methyltransferase [Candidatus Omnitrophota bacterium]|nr:class I SAM-dependent methyltransferase [Candidatus Omnitrophota bacterium]